MRTCASLLVLLESEVAPEVSMLCHHVNYLAANKMPCFTQTASQPSATVISNRLRANDVMKQKHPPLRFSSAISVKSLWLSIQSLP